MQFNRLRQVHQFLAHQALYPILLSTLLAFGLFAGRVFSMDKLAGRPILSTATTQSHLQELDKSGQARMSRVSVHSWIDENEHSFIQFMVEFSLMRAFELQWQELGRVGRFGILKVFLIPLADEHGRALVRFLAELSLSHTLTYAFLIWNLFLAWVPYIASLGAAFLHQRHPGRWWYLLIPGALWLSFFPNAPYIVTDFLHLRERAPIPLWYDIGMLTVFAWTGLFLAVFSLRTMQTLVKSFLGSAASWLFVVGSLGLGGLGIYIGRFLRWNSWDLLLNPRSVLADVIIRLSDPWNHPGALGVTFMFSAFLLVCYLTVTIIPSREHSALRDSEFRS
jgi:uncharacterized membrane protein